MSHRQQTAIIRCLAGEIGLADAAAAAAAGPAEAGLDAREQILVARAVDDAGVAGAVGDVLQARRWGTAPLTAAALAGDVSALPVHAPSAWDCAEIAAWLDARGAG